MNRRIAAAALLSLSLSLVAAPPGAGAETWNVSYSRLTEALKEYRHLASRAADAGRLEAALERLEQAVGTVLSAATAAPGPVERIRTVLELVDDWPPEVHHRVYLLLERAVGVAIRALDEGDLSAFATYARTLWSAETKKNAERVLLQRMVVATALAQAEASQPLASPLVAFALDVLRREAAWVTPQPKTPLSLSRAVRALGAQPESATIYPVLDVVERVYDAAFRGDATATLEPFVTALIELLAKVEVRVEGRRRGDVLPAEDPRNVSQMRLWFRVTSILQKWTGETQYVWSHDWLKFWTLYSGADRGQKRFDFRAALNATSARGRTRRVAGTDAFFGIEAKTSKFLILLDVSRSMDRNPQNVDRFTPLKEEAIRFITSLRPGVHYNILPFSSTCDIGKSLTGSHKLKVKRLPSGEISDEARRWILELRTEGSTRVDLAFRSAFAMAGPSARRRNRGPTFNEVYFITDGSPTNDALRVMNDRELLELLSLIRGLNARHRVIIHTVGFPRMDSRFIRQLAIEHGGTAATIRM